MILGSGGKIWPFCYHAAVRRVEEFKTLRSGKVCIYIWRIEKSWLTKNCGHLGVRKWPRRGTTKKKKWAPSSFSEPPREKIRVLL